MARITQAHRPFWQVKLSAQSSSVLQEAPAMVSTPSQGFRKRICSGPLTSTVSIPVASRARASSGGSRSGGRPRTTTATANLGHERVAQASDAVVELVEALSIPGGTVGAGNGFGTGECNVEDVVLVVAVVSIHAVSEARRSKRNRGLAHLGVRAVVAVLVAPDTVELGNWLANVSLLRLGREGQPRGGQL